MIVWLRRLRTPHWQQRAWDGVAAGTYQRDPEQPRARAPRARAGATACQLPRM